jgi:hypothetical protein
MATLSTACDRYTPIAPLSLDAVRCAGCDETRRAIREEGPL